ncbi:MAG: sigma-70 family RNA polymerase sigma factor [Elusimicrobiaceae bacterium]|nr:sigma-70 family RNA polymerase sigma factor [Elusimicrobiaceae bacterium]
MEYTELDSATEYFKHLGQITKEIDREELARLWKRAKKGDAAAKHRIMEMNLRLVIPTAKRFQRPGMELMDLIEEGNLGLMQAIEKFEPQKGYRFSTYAIYWIEQYIRKYIEEQSGSIKIPSHAWGNLKKWFKAWNELKEANGRDPSLREMAEELDLSARQVKSIMDTLNAAKGVDSLTALVREEDEMTLEEIISDDGKGNPHDVFLANESQSNLKQSLDDLQERDRTVIVLRYGLDDNNPKTLGEVADMMGLSRERVRQIEERAVRLLRQAARKAGIIEMRDENFRTTKLHTAMRTRVKTNILGEEIDDSPLAKFIRHKVAQVKKHIAQRKAAEAKETRAEKKKASKKNTVRKVTKNAKKVASKAPRKRSNRRTAKKIKKR